MQCDFTWSLMQARIKSPILRADLAHFNLFMHMKNKTLSDNIANVYVTYIYTQYTTVLQ